MKRCPPTFLGMAALALSLAIYSLTAAEYSTAPLPVPAQPTAPVAATNRTEASPQPGELELKSQFKLLTDLAQEHRQRAEAATKDDQAPKAKWETDLAEELSSRGSNILVQLEKGAAQKQALANGSQPETPASLSPAETEYLAKVQERLQTVQQEIAAATEETTAYALASATNRDTVVYGDNSDLLRMQELARNVKRLQAEQAELDLKTSQFWALRAMLRSTQNALPR